MLTLKRVFAAGILTAGALGFAFNSAAADSHATPSTADLVAKAQTVLNGSRKTAEVGEEGGSGMKIPPNPALYELLGNRTIRLNGVSEQSAAEVIQALHFLDAIAPGEDITLKVNSYGGDVYAALAIVDAMRSLQSDVRTVCEGKAMSAGALILSAGTPGKRVSEPHCTVMIHQVSGGAQGKVVDIANDLREASRLNNLLIRIMVEQAKMNEQELAKIMERDHYMTPQEALDAGLIDAVVTPAKRKPVIAPHNIVAAPSVMMPR